MDHSASAGTKDLARIRRRRPCTPPRFSSTLPVDRRLAETHRLAHVLAVPTDLLEPPQTVDLVFKRTLRFGRACGFMARTELPYRLAISGRIRACLRKRRST